MTKKRLVVVLMSVVVLMLATIAPAGAIDPPNVQAHIEMPGGSVQIIDYIFDINIHFDVNGDKLVDFRLPGGTLIEGFLGQFLEIIHPEPGGGGICVPGECD